MPKLRNYLLATLLTAAACAALAQTPAPQRVDTVYDTVYRVDTVAQSAANDKYYDLAEKALNHRMTTITIILTLIGFLFVSLSILLVVEARRISSKIDHELELARKDTANAVLTAKNEALQARHSIECDLKELKTATKAELDKVRTETDTSVRDIRRLKDEAQQHILDTKEQAKKELEEITEAKKKVFEQAAEIEIRIAELTLKTERPIREAEQKAAESPGINFDEKLKLIESADAEEAIKQYELLIADMKKEGVPETKIPSSLRRNIGFNYYRLDRYERAVSELLEYLKDSPNDEDSLFAVAYGYHELHVYEASSTYYERVTDVNPARAAAFYNWGISLGKLYDGTKKTELLDLACQKYEQAVAIKPDYHEAFTNWSNSLLILYHATQEKRYLEEALKKSSCALELAPERKDHNYNRGCALALLGKKDEMLAALKEAILYDNEHKKMARKDEDFKAYLDDPDFIALTKEDGGEKTG